MVVAAVGAARGGEAFSWVEGSEAGFGCSAAASGCVVFDLLAHANKKKTVTVTNKILTRRFLDERFIRPAFCVPSSLPCLPLPAGRGAGRLSPVSDQPACFTSMIFQLPSSFFSTASKKVLLS